MMHRFRKKSLFYLQSSAVISIDVSVDMQLVKCSFVANVEEPVFRREPQVSRLLLPFQAKTVASTKVPVSRDLWPWPWAHPGCALTCGPSCASLVAIEPFACEKKRFSCQHKSARITWPLTLTLTLSYPPAIPSEDGSCLTSSEGKSSPDPARSPLSHLQSHYPILWSHL